MAMERPDFGSVGFGDAGGGEQPKESPKCDTCGAAMQEGWISCPTCDAEQGKAKPKPEAPDLPPAEPEPSATPDLPPAAPDLPAAPDTPPDTPELPVSAGGEGAGDGGGESLDDLFGKLDSLDDGGKIRLLRVHYFPQTEQITSVEIKEYEDGDDYDDDVNDDIFEDPTKDIILTPETEEAAKIKYQPGTGK